MELNLHRLWIFTQVVECGGFSAAAEKLYMSQPSVSTQVRQLERTLRVTLVDRTGNSVRPTAEGEMLAEYARRMLLLADEAVAAVRQVSGVQVGRLRVGGTTTAGTYLLPKLLSRFRDRYPGIDCDIVVGNGQQVLRRLLDGEVGIALLAGDPGAPQLVAEPILRERLVLATAPGRPSDGTPVSSDTLADEWFLLREQGSATRELQETALVQWGLEHVKRSEVGAPEAIKQAVAAGLGVSLISEHAVADDVRGGRLAAVDVDPPTPTRPIVLAYRRERVLAPAEQAFVRLLREVQDWP